MASLRASRHCSLASLMAPQLLRTATSFMEQFNSSESSCHFSTRLSPAQSQTEERQRISTETKHFSCTVGPCAGPTIPWSMKRVSEGPPLGPYRPFPTKVTSRLQRSFRLSYRAVSGLFIPETFKQSLAPHSCNAKCYTNLQLRLSEADVLTNHAV